MRAFILRRLELIARHLGDVVVIGSRYCAGTLRVKEFPIRNGHPFQDIDLGRDHEAQELLDRFQVSLAEIPVVISRGDAVPGIRRVRRLRGSVPWILVQTFTATA